MLAYSGWIYYLSSGVVDVPLPSFPYQDKVLHAIAYGVMGAIAWVMFRQWPFFQRAWIWAWVYTSGYGVTDEWHQFYVPGRYVDVWDCVADSFGAALFISILEYIRYRQENVKDPVIYFHSRKGAQRLAQKLSQMRDQGRLPPPGYRGTQHPRPELPHQPPSGS
ncbi:MAG: VanZ family protein [Magnetococcales bacterium]|nr:VanZ family protein [Magnetococcales bacterium]HIJ82995.1 VanZ family protein [Magnetococcales bacterium]